MIFVSVGSMMPFDRLIRAVDDWAGDRGSDEVFAQIGYGKFIPCHMPWASMLTPMEFNDRCKCASVIVSHAGMGTVLTAMQFRRPLVVMPRKGRLNETTSDHQVATARWLAKRPGITVVEDEAVLVAYLDRGCFDAADNALSAHASDELIETVKAFIAHA